MKICSKCGIEKSKSSFSKHKKNRDGLAYACKKCRKEISRKYREENGEVIRGRKKKYYLENKNHCKAKSKKYRTENKEYHSEWQKNNLNKVASYQQNRRARKLENGGEFTDQEWQDLKEKTGNKCLCCGISGEEVTLAMDHIIPISKGGSERHTEYSTLMQELQFK